MATPTDYDKEQDRRLENVEALVTGPAPDNSADEFSYPIVGQPMTDDMWGWVTRGVGSGILDQGGFPYKLTSLSNTSDTGVLTVSTKTGTANAIVNGFFHQLNKDMTIPLPPVSTTTTYYVCLTYDPLGHDAAGGPVSVQVYTTTPPITQGKIHVLLWTVTRRPNQILSDATVERHVTRVAPTIMVYDPAELPDVSTVLWGTIAFAHRYAEIYMATSNAGTDKPTEWKSLTNPEWINSTSNTWIAYSNLTQPRFRYEGDRIYLSGVIKRSNGATLGPGSEYTFIPNLPPAERDTSIGLSNGSPFSLERECSIKMRARKGNIPIFGVAVANTSQVSLDGFFYYWK